MARAFGIAETGALLRPRRANQDAGGAPGRPSSLIAFQRRDGFLRVPRSPARLRCEELVECVSAGEVVVDSVSVKVMVVMMTVHCHRGAHQYKRKYSRSDQSEFRHDRSPFRG
jgi:hypothetical protein